MKGQVTLSKHERTVRDLVCWILTVSPNVDKLRRMEARVGKGAIDEALVRCGKVR